MDKIERKICDIIESHSEEIISIGRDIWHHAELGFQEYRTAAKADEFFRRFGMQTQTGLAVTGVKCYLKDNAEPSDITVALVGEMDGLPIPEHVDANPETGASHCCGHNAQMAGLLGSVFALTDPEVKAALGGNVSFMAVPAEEFNQPEARAKMREEGKIRYDGGKCELIRLGAFDDIDITVGHHSAIEGELEYANIINNGFVTKNVAFKGKSAHAAGFPDKGVDALAAAEFAMHAVSAQRESFRDKDSVRVYGFITKGGVATNIIADDVCMDYCIRASSVEAITNTSEKVDRAMKSAAVATGCGVRIATIPGYLPTYPIPDVSAMEEAMKVMAEADGYHYKYVGPQDRKGAASTDFGDVSAIMPVFQFHTGGVSGDPHNANMRIVDEKLAYVAAAKLFALSAYELLKDGGSKAKRLKASFQAPMDKKAYLAFKESLMAVETVEYHPIPPLHD